MIRIPITPAAFEAIVATMPLGSVGYEGEPNEIGERMLEEAVIARLADIRRPGEPWSDVILRLVEIEAGGRPADSSCLFASKWAMISPLAAWGFPSGGKPSSPADSLTRTRHPTSTKGFDPDDGRHGRAWHGRHGSVRSHSPGSCAAAVSFPTTYCAPRATNRRAPGRT